jgi:hypothetical protein
MGTGGSPNGALIFSGVPVGVTCGISLLRRAAQRVRRAIQNRKSDQGNKEQRKYQKRDFSRGGHRNSFPEPEVLDRETWLTVLGITLWREC